MTFRVRRVEPSRPGVERLLRDLHDACFGSDAPMPIWDGWWWVASHPSGVPVGFCGLTRSYDRSNYAYLKRAGVLPKFRGHGLQGRMIRLRLRKARQEGFLGVITNSAKDNTPSSNNLAQAGLRMYTPAKPWDFKTSLYWKMDF